VQVGRPLVRRLRQRKVKTHGQLFGTNLRTGTLRRPGPINNRYFGYHKYYQIAAQLSIENIWMVSTEKVMSGRVSHRAAEER
jgi:hypothetical protein